MVLPLTIFLILGESKKGSVFGSTGHEIACDITVSFHLPKMAPSKKSAVMAKRRDFYPSQTIIPRHYIIYVRSQVFRGHQQKTASFFSQEHVHLVTCARSVNFSSREEVIVILVIRCQSMKSSAVSDLHFFNFSNLPLLIFTVILSSRPLPYVDGLYV